jgi:hypothetical protein
MIREARLSADGKHRYSLVRTWDFTRPRLRAVMLNPSTADADVDDHTVRKLIGFCERLGYESLEIANLFSFRATDPKELRWGGGET